MMKTPARLTITFLVRRSLASMFLMPFLLLAGTANGGVCDGEDAPISYPWMDPSTYARPLKVLPPDYPATQFQKGVTAKVETVLRISGMGKLLEVVSIKADNGDEAFEKAVREVVGYWTFSGYEDCECKPMDFTARMTVWFEIKDAQPAISVSSEPPQPRKKPAGKPLRISNAQEVAQILSSNYPRIARRHSQQAIVIARIHVNPTTGAVDSIDIQHVEGNKDYQHHFAAAAEFGLRQAQYDVTGVEMKPPLRVCFQVNYRLQGRE